MPKKVKGRHKSTRAGGPKGFGSKAGAAFGGIDNRRLLADMRAYHDNLTTQCSRLQAEMDAISSAIGSLSGFAGRGPTVQRRVTSGATRGPRPSGGSLKEVISRVLGSAGKPMRLMDIAGGVVRAGYKTKSKNLSNQVSMALADLAKKRKVRKVGRGLYRV